MRGRRLNNEAQRQEAMSSISLPRQGVDAIPLVAPNHHTCPTTHLGRESISEFHRWRLPSHGPHTHKRRASKWRNSDQGRRRKRRTTSAKPERDATSCDWALNAINELTTGLQAVAHAQNQKSTKFRPRQLLSQPKTELSQLSRVIACYRAPCVIAGPDPAITPKKACYRKARPCDNMLSGGGTLR